MLIEKIDMVITARNIVEIDLWELYICKVMVNHAEWPPIVQKHRSGKRKVPPFTKRGGSGCRTFPAG
jgi:hypothetical protein